MKSDLASDKTLMKYLENVLAMRDYPVGERHAVFIGFESQETVDRESNGDWYAHFK